MKVYSYVCWARVGLVSAGGEAEGSGSVCDVSVPLQITRMDLDENQLLHLPEPVFRGDRVYHLHQCQCQVSQTFKTDFANTGDYVTRLHNRIQHIMKPLTSWNVTVVKDCSVWMFECSPTTCNPHFLSHPHHNLFSINHTVTDHCFPTPLPCVHLWLWGSRNSTQDPLTPISSPGGSLPPSLGQNSPNGPPVVLSPGHVATRWDQAWPDYPPPAWETRGCFFTGDYHCFVSGKL